MLCTPHTQHADQIVAAANAKKHVFCEKPLSLNRADVLRAVKACSQNEVALAVGHEKRFEPPIQELVRLAKAGELGTLLQIEANFSQDKFLSLTADNWRMSEKEAPAGPMTATGIHLLDLSVGLLGPAQQVYARVRQLGSRLVNGDTLGILVTHKSGANSLISAVLATPFDGRFALYGNKGWAEVRDKAHPEAPQGWTLTTSFRGAEKKIHGIPACESRARQPRGLRRRRGEARAVPGAAGPDDRQRVGAGGGVPLGEERGGGDGVEVRSQFVYVRETELRPDPELALAVAADAPDDGAAHGVLGAES